MLWPIGGFRAFGFTEPKGAKQRTTATLDARRNTLTLTGVKS